MIDIAAEVTVALAPVLAELAAVRFELAEVRASLPPRMLSLVEAAEALGVSTQTVRAMFGDGRISGRRAGRRILIDASSLRPKTSAEIAALAREARG